MPNLVFLPTASKPRPLSQVFANEEKTAPKTDRQRMTAEDFVRVATQYRDLIASRAERGDDPDDILADFLLKGFSERWFDRYEPAYAKPGTFIAVLIRRFMIDRQRGLTRRKARENVYGTSYATRVQAPPSDGACHVAIKRFTLSAVSRVGPGNADLFNALVESGGDLDAAAIRVGMRKDDAKRALREIRTRLTALGFDRVLADAVAGD